MSKRKGEVHTCISIRGCCVEKKKKKRTQTQKVAIEGEEGLIKVYDSKGELEEVKKKGMMNYQRGTVSTDLSGPDVLVLIDEGVNVVVLELLDDGVGDIEVGLVVLTADWLHTRPVHTCQSRS